MNKFIIFTIIYIFLTTLLISTFNNEVFVTDQKGTAIIAVIIYVLIFILFLIFKGIKKLFKKTN